jgi:transposase-like protein
MSIPSLYELRDIFFDEQNCINYLISRSVFYTSHTCEIHNKEMKYYENRQRFRCTTKHCTKQVSLRANTFFANSKLEIHKIMYFGYLWLNRISNEAIKTMTGLSRDTVADFAKYFRQLITDSLEEEDTIIGGDGIIIQLDETKLGKRKYNRGHSVDGVWILGGVELTNERKFFAVSVPNRSTKTLVSIITQHVRPNSIIHTDLWRGYSSLSNINNYTHCTVNHSRNFKDPSTGVHTNHIEGTWFAVKRAIAVRNRTSEHADLHVFEFIWRRKNAEHLWDALLNALSSTHYN